MGLRFEEIAEIMKIIDSSSCDEFVLETEEIKLVVRRRSTNGAAPPHFTELAPTASTVTAALRLSPDADLARPQAPAADEGKHIVCAPMVGTFYRAPSPEAPPFVDVGSSVKVGDPLCMIEVMKLFTTIHAECAGRIVEIGVKNQAPVEYGQMLFVIEPV